MFKAIVHDRELGILYYATCDIAHENIVTLFKPIYKNRLSTSIQKFKKGYTYHECEYEDYGTKCNDLMLPISTLFIELLSDTDVVPWAEVTKEDAEKKLYTLEVEAEKTYDEAKKAYLDKKNGLVKILYKIFN